MSANHRRQSLPFPLLALSQRLETRIQLGFPRPCLKVFSHIRLLTTRRQTLITLPGSKKPTSECVCTFPQLFFFSFFFIDTFFGRWAQKLTLTQNNHLRHLLMLLQWGGGIVLYSGFVCLSLFYSILTMSADGWRERLTVLHRSCWANIWQRRSLLCSAGGAGRESNLTGALCGSISPGCRVFVHFTDGAAWCLLQRSRLSPRPNLPLHNFNGFHP